MSHRSNTRLRRKAHVQGYLDAAFASGDAKLIALALGHVIRANGTILQASRDTGVSASGLNSIFGETKPTVPNLATVMAILKIMGVTLRVELDDKVWSEDDHG